MTPISTHPRINPLRTRLIAWFSAAILGTTALAVLAMLVISIINVLPLLFITAVFFIILITPVLLLTSLHPAIDIHEDGLQVTPLVWKSHFVAWEDLSHLSRHRLLGPAPTQRSGKKEVEGLMVIANRGQWHYRVVGFFAGYPGKPIFAVSDRTHQDYNKLKHNLKKTLPFREDNE